VRIAQGDLTAAQEDAEAAVTHYAAARPCFEKAKNEYAVR
jgi:hypothetical protein